MSEERLSHHFVIGKVDDGSWLAVADRQPYFCFQAETSDSVVAIANRAFDFYFGTRGQIADDQPSKGKREKTLSTFRPIKRIEKECERG